MIGLIVNPLSSKDIRRLVALGRVVPVEEKANLVARFLAGVAGGPATEILAFDDPAGIVRRAARFASDRSLRLTYLDRVPTGTVDDTIAASHAFREAEVDLVAVVGGDGTLRAAVQGWPSAPVLLLSAGTNNAFSSPVEPTVAGLAAAHLGSAQVRESSFHPRARLEVETGGSPVTAVVDVVGVRDEWLGSRAIWRPEDLVEAVVAHADPASIGVSAIAAAFGPLAPGEVRYLKFGPGHAVRVAFGPGLVREVSVAGHRDLPLEEIIRLAPETGVVALDGERQMAEGAAGRVIGRPGPLAFDPGRALASAYGAGSGKRDLLP